MVALPRDCLIIDVAEADKVVPGSPDAMATSSILLSVHTQMEPRTRGRPLARQ